MPGRRRGRAGGASRPASPRASTRTRAARASTSTRRAVCAATTTSPRWSGDGPGRRITAPSTRRRAGSCSRPAAGSARSARATGRCPSRPWSGSSSRSFRSRAVAGITRRGRFEARPLAVSTSRTTTRRRAGRSTTSGFEHERHSMLPGSQLARCGLLEAARDGAGAGPGRRGGSCDSTSDHRSPRAPLAGPRALSIGGRPERRRALELEEFFDEEAGSRRSACSPSTSCAMTPTTSSALLMTRLPGPLARRGDARRRCVPVKVYAEAPLPGQPRPTPRTGRRQGVTGAWTGSRRRLGRAEYLVGDGFTVADLAAAALLYPVGLAGRGSSTTTRSPPALGAGAESLARRPRRSSGSRRCTAAIAAASAESRPPLPPRPPPGRRRGAPPPRSPNGRDARLRPRARGSAPRSR